MACRLFQGGTFEKVPRKAAAPIKIPAKPNTEE
jgi:hypothetical protein